MSLLRVTTLPFRHCAENADAEPYLSPGHMRGYGANDLPNLVGLAFIGWKLPSGGTLQRAGPARKRGILSLIFTAENPPAQLYCKVGRLTFVTVM